MSDNDLDVEIFINNVCIRRELWDGSSGSKDALWRELSVKFKLPIATLKRKWENLRKSFRCQLKKIPRDGQNEFLSDPRLLVSNFPYYRSMLFLAETIRIGPRKGIKTKQNPRPSSSNSTEGGTMGIMSQPNGSDEDVTPKKRRISDGNEDQKRENHDVVKISKIGSNETEDIISLNASDDELEIEELSD